MFDIGDKVVCKPPYGKRFTGQELTVKFSRAHSMYKGGGYIISCEHPRSAIAWGALEYSQITLENE